MKSERGAEPPKIIMTEISKDDSDMLFALMDLNNAQMGKIDKISDPQIRALCADTNPALVSSFSVGPSAQDREKARVEKERVEKEYEEKKGKKKRPVPKKRKILLRTENSEQVLLNRKRILARGYTKDEVLCIFEFINRWLLKRYEYIIAKSEGYLDASDNPFSRAKMLLNAEVALGTGQLRGELFEESSDDNDENDEASIRFGAFSSYNRAKKKKRLRIDEVERIQELSRRHAKEANEENEDEEEEEEEIEGMTSDQAKQCYIESKVIVDVKAICTVGCSKTLVNRDFSVHGCNDHGIIHICAGDESCIHVTGNRDKELVCVYTGAAVGKVYQGTRVFHNKRRNIFYSVAGGMESSARKQGEKSVIEQDYLNAISKYASETGSSKSMSNARGILPDNVTEFVQIVDTEFNMAMVESAIRSGQRCVVTDLAAAILIDKFFVSKIPRNLTTEEEEEEGPLDVIARRMAQRTSSRGLLEANRGSFVDDISVPPSARGRTPFSRQNTPFTPRVVSEAIKNSFHSPESRKRGVGPSIIPSEDYIFTGDTFVSPDVFRGVSASCNDSTSPTVQGQKENALYSSSHRVMCTSPVSNGVSRRCASPLSSSPLGGGSPRNSPISTIRGSALDKETRYEINPYRGVQKTLRTWERVLKTGERPMNIIMPSMSSASSPLARSVMVPQTPIATSKQVREQEAYLQSRAGVVMTRRKRGRNSLVRSFKEDSSSRTTRITRGSRPGRSKKNENLYTSDMFKVYMPNQEKQKHLSSNTLETSSEVCANTDEGSTCVSMGISPSPLLRKVLTTGKTSPSRKTNGLVSEETHQARGKKRSIEFHKDQYFLVKGEKPKTRNTNLKAIALLNRTRQLKRIKRQEAKAQNKNDAKEEDVFVHENKEGPKKEIRRPDATSTVLMGRVADMLIGKPSISSIYRIVQAEIDSSKEDAMYAKKNKHTSTNHTKAGSVDRSASSESEEDDGLLDGVETRPNVLQSRSIQDAQGYSEKKEKMSQEHERVRGRWHEEEGKEEREENIQTRVEKFLRWIEKKSLVFTDDMEQYKGNVRTVMVDLIFCSKKRRSMKMAYRIVSIVGAKDEIKTRACQASRELKQIRKGYAKGEKHVFSEDEKDVLFEHRRRLTLGAIDDVFGMHLQKHDIDVVPNNGEKMRQYTNEIYYLWRLLLTSKYAAGLKNPKAQFDHFVLGVLYLLAERDLVLCDCVILKKDPWLKKVLPRRKRLCENYVSKLNKNEVAREIQKNTDLVLDMLTFSSHSRVYNTRIITKGCTRVKDLLYHLDQEITMHRVVKHKQRNGGTSIRKSGMFSDIDGSVVKHYLTMNSSMIFIQVRKTSGNIRQAARVHNRRPVLFS